MGVGIFEAEIGNWGEEILREIGSDWRWRAIRFRKAGEAASDKKMEEVENDMEISSPIGVGPWGLCFSFWRLSLRLILNITH